jgi:membrane fusion protein (multidrug efflux system)
MIMSNTRKFLGGLVGAASTLSASYFILGDGDLQRTDDAYVSADFSIVAPKISGLIDRVDVADNEHVRAGQELAHIDERDYRAAVSSASAALAAANADVENLTAEIARHQSLVEQADATVKADNAALSFAQANATRYSNLSRGGAGTVEQQQQSTSLLQQALANKDRDTAAATATERQLAILEAQRDKAVAAAAREKAELKQGQLNLSYTHVLAPFDGVVGQRSVRVGNYVGPGTALLAVVPLEAAYVLANFQETQLTNIAPGQKASVTVDTFPGQILTGVVDSLAPASGIAFSPIPPDNATGNFTKVVQRIPLKITFDKGQPLLSRLRVGMSVEASVETAIQNDTGRYEPPHNEASQ